MWKRCIFQTFAQRHLKNKSTEMYKPFILLFLLFNMQPVSAQKTLLPEISWHIGAGLQATNGEPSPGLAGPVNGISNGVFLTAGGANFPDKLPWEGGKKRYYDSIYAYRIVADEMQALRGGSLPEKAAYAGSTSTPAGIVYAGGENAAGIQKSAWLLTWDPTTEKAMTAALPDLPLAVTNVALTSMDKVVFAAGGDMSSRSSDGFFSLDLSVSPEKRQWKPLPDLPLPLANAALFTLGHKIFLVGGRTKSASGISDLHNTVFSFDTVGGVWKQHRPIRNHGRPVNLSAAAGVAIGDECILMIGGDDGRIFHRIETLISEINSAKISEEKTALTAKKLALQTDHPGFNRSLLLYNANTDTWRNLEEFPFPAQVTTTAVRYNDSIIISNGEIKPGIRTPSIIIGKIKTEK